MFRCQVTNRMSKPGEKVNKVVLATRDRIYTAKFRNEETNQWETVEIGRGWEIVKEINACQEGVEIVNAMTPAERAAFCKSVL